MRNKMMGLLFSRSLFVKLMCSFVIVILIVSFFNIVAYGFYVRSIEREIINNANARLDKLFNDLEQYFDNLEKTIICLYLEEEFQKVLNKPYIADYDINVLYKCLGLYKNELPYVSMLYFLTPEIDFVVTPYATYNKDRFFNVFYSNSVYNEDYWLQEMSKDFNIRLYPAMNFVDYGYKQETGFEKLMPLVFKKPANNRFMIIALVDVDALMIDIDRSFINNFYILGKDRSSFYSHLTDVDVLDLPMNQDDAFERIDQGYLFCRESDRYSIQYYKFFPNDEIMGELKRTSFFLVLFIGIPLLVSLGVSIYIVKRFNNPVRQIVEIIKRSEKDEVKVNDVDFQNIRNYVQRLLSNNAYYQEQISLKDSMLKGVSYQFKIKNIYTYINQLAEEVTIKNDYALIYFKVFYRDRYFDEISQDTSLGTFYLKELIELYVQGYFTNSITFNIEDNQIISIVNIDKEKRDIKCFVQEIADKLETENNYIFLTVVVGRIYKDVSKLSYAYDKVVEIAQYRQLNRDTQILEEEKMVNRNSGFYFSLEQAEQFTKLLLNGQEEECVLLVKNIMEYNYKKKVNQFCINLLSNELINHSLKVLMELYYSIPDDLNVHSVYFGMGKCSSIDEYIALFEGFVLAVIRYIRSHDKKEDHIIDYVKEYIGEHYMEDVNLELLAEKLNITKTYLSSYFKSKTGINFSDYLNNFRIQKAIMLLEDLDAKIRDVSLKVGIQNVNTFTRVFKKYMGYTPSEYRQREICQRN